MANPQITLGSIVSPPMLPESVEVLAVVPMGQSLKFIGRGRGSGQPYDPVLNPQQLAAIIGRSAEGRERQRLREILEHFFIDAAPESRTLLEGTTS
jgi:hypothetical protein